MITLIVIDIGGVLMEDADSWGSMYQNIPLKVGLTNQEVDAIWMNHWPRMSVGQESLVGFFSELVDKAKHKTTVKELLQIYKDSTTFDEKAVDLVKNLRRNGYRIIALTNETREGMEIRVKKLGNIFETVYNSALLGVRKPDPRIFQHVIQKENAKPAQTLFIDDREPNIAVAKRMGMRTILFKNLKQLRKDLSGNL